MIDFNSIMFKAKCVAIFLQPTSSTFFGTDTFVINFIKDGQLLSFHSFSMIRLVYGKQILYTVTDHYLNDHGMSWRTGQKKLSTKTFYRLKNTIIGQKITRFLRKGCGDIVMKFENGAKLEFLIDCSKALKKEEAHRLLVFKNQNYDICDEHYIFEK